jgi:phenylacetate-CoA ligase
MIWNRAAEAMPRAEREGLQLARLRETVAWVAERVPFYAPLREARITGLADLSALPCTRKADLRE